jgi:hypothetical protein
MHHLVYSRLPSIIVLLPYILRAKEPTDEGSMYFSAFNVSQPNVFYRYRKY